MPVDHQPMSDYSSRTERIERYLSLAVGVAVIAALLVSMYQANLARAQLRASAWPYLQQGNTGTGEGRPYTRVVINQGIGPARIRTVQVLVDDRPVPDWDSAVRALTGAKDSGLTYSSFGRGSVLPAGAERTLVSLPHGPIAEKFWLEAQRRLRTVTCYCSVYDECWTADSHEDEPVQVGACTVDTAAEFHQ